MIKAVSKAKKIRDWMARKRSGTASRWQLIQRCAKETGIPIQYVQYTVYCSDKRREYWRDRRRNQLPNQPIRRTQGAKVRVRSLKRGKVGARLLEPA